MGSNPSKLREGLSVAVVVYLCHRYVNKYIDGAVRERMIREAREKRRTPSTGGMGERKTSFGKLRHAISKERAVEMDRYHPGGAKEVFVNFCHSWLVCFVLDVLFARRMKARWFALHALLNCVVVPSCVPDLIKAFCEPAKSMEGGCSVAPAYLVPALFIYHLTTFKNVPADEWYHHVIFGGCIASSGIAYCPGPLQNAIAFFINGLPGGIDYAMLAACKEGWMQLRTEKILNTHMNVWVRSPGLVITGYIVYVGSKYGKTTFPQWCAALVSFLAAFNGTYYMQRVVASAALNDWRPS